MPSDPRYLRMLLEEDGWVGGTGSVAQDSTGRNIFTPQRPKA
eukprot:gene9589-3326_t